MTALQIAYLSLTVVITIIVLFGYHYALKQLLLPKQQRVKRVLVVFLSMAVWGVYIYLIAKTEILKDYSLPPRFPILTILPLFLFTGILLFTKRNSEVIKLIPRSWAIYFQTFRILVESLFVASVGAGLLHKEVTIEGYNFDMIFACTAPLIGFLVFRSKMLSERIALYWNYLGLTVIASIIMLFTTTVFFPHLWGNAVSNAPPEFLDFPYILVAAFLMPVAVFVHIFSIIQLTRK